MSDDRIREIIEALRRVRRRREEWAGRGAVSEDDGGTAGFGPTNGRE